MKGEKEEVEERGSKHSGGRRRSTFKKQGREGGRENKYPHARHVNKKAFAGTHKQKTKKYKQKTKRKVG